MALFTDIVFNADTGKHELVFVNQQYDFLMSIVYDNESKGYRLNCSVKEAEENFEFFGGRKFDLNHWLKEAETRLREKDAALHAGNRKTDE